MSECAQCPGKHDDHGQDVQPVFPSHELSPLHSAKFEKKDDGNVDRGNEGDSDRPRLNEGDHWCQCLACVHKLSANRPESYIRAIRGVLLDPIFNLALGVVIGAGVSLYLVEVALAGEGFRAACGSVLP